MRYEGRQWSYALGSAYECACAYEYDYEDDDTDRDADLDDDPNLAPLNTHNEKMTRRTHTHNNN